MPIHVEDDDENLDEPDAVGYRKPPKHTQFKKGRSGNPAGRPKKFVFPRRKRHPIEAAFLKPMTVKSNGKTITKSTLEIGIMTILHKAIAKGDAKNLLLLANEIGGIGSFLNQQRQEESEAQMKEIEAVRKRANEYLKDVERGSDSIE